MPAPPLKPLSMPASSRVEVSPTIAKLSRAQSYNVDEAGQLNSIYRRLGSRLGSKREHHQVTAGFATGGALLLALALALSLRWAGRLP